MCAGFACPDCGGFVHERARDNEPHRCEACGWASRGGRGEWKDAPAGWRHWFDLFALWGINDREAAKAGVEKPPQILAARKSILGAMGLRDGEIRVCKRGRFLVREEALLEHEELRLTWCGRSAADV